MKIAVVCALPDLANSGMLSVDLAFETLTKYFNTDIEVVRFSAWKEITRTGPIPMQYQKLSNVEQLANFDKIVYWGDFLHWCRYGPSFISTPGVNQYAAEHNITTKEAKLHMTELWYSMYMLEGRVDLQKKAIVFGGTIHGIDSSQMADTRYHTALTSLYTNANMVLMRDYLSAFHVSEMFDYRKFSYGCDCSLLLEIDTTEYKDNKQNTPYMVYAFGRCKDDEHLEKFALALAKKTNVRAVNVNWLHPTTSVTTLLQNLELIKNAKFAVTDIYHFAINAWREQTPTFTIGKGNSYPSQGTLVDKKKEIFNSQILAMNHYLYFENVMSNSPEVNTTIINNCLTKLKDTAAINVIFEKIKCQQLYAKQAIIKEVNK